MKSCVLIILLPKLIHFDVCIFVWRLNIYIKLSYNFIQNKNRYFQRIEIKKKDGTTRLLVNKVDVNCF